MKPRDTIANCATLAALLEVSSYPKPGNVHRLRDHGETKYEHFLAASATLGTHIGKLAGRSRELGAERLDSLKIGKTILSSVQDMLQWQSGGNVHLGVTLLFAPLAAAAGLVMKDEAVDPETLGEEVKRVIDQSSAKDTTNIYRAINMAMSVENLGEASRLDVTDPESIQTILNEDWHPRKIFSECVDRDSICREWVTNFEITFKESYPYLSEQLTNGTAINKATMTTFLHILSKHPDSLIARKSGEEAAKEVSKRAKTIINQGGSSTGKGLEMINNLDVELSEANGLMNPGTTADLTAAALFIQLLTGWRP